MYASAQDTEHEVVGNPEIGSFKRPYAERKTPHKQSRYGQIHHTTTYGGANSLNGLFTEQRIFFASEKYQYHVPGCGCAGIIMLYKEKHNGKRLERMQYTVRFKKYRQCNPQQ